MYTFNIFILSCSKHYFKALLVHPKRSRPDLAWRYWLRTPRSCRCKGPFQLVFRSSVLAENWSVPRAARGIQERRSSASWCGFKWASGRKCFCSGRDSSCKSAQVRSPAPSRAHGTRALPLHPVCSRLDWCAVLNNSRHDESLRPAQDVSCWWLLLNATRVNHADVKLHFGSTLLKVFTALNKQLLEHGVQKCAVLCWWCWRGFINSLQDV